MAQFFIRRPIVAMVISILIVLIGLKTLVSLPIEQYPQLAPPNIQVTATYPGASAEVVEQSVATPIEQQVNGVDNMIYMKSLNSSDGRMLLNVTFDVGVSLDNANMLTQNRVAQAQSRLAQEVIAQGVTVKKVNPSILMVVSIYSPNDTYDSLFLNNYAVLNVKDALLRVPGISQVDMAGGAEYGMRIWLQPDKLAKLGLTPADVIGAIREQNLQAPAGQIGGAPSGPDQEFTFTVRAPGRLSSPEEFGEILVRSTDDGRQVRVKDVARVELGGEFYKSFGRYNGKEAGVLLIYLLPGANQIESANGIYAELENLKQFFPGDVDYAITYDSTPAVKASIEEIFVTLYEAIILVVLVVFIFLQNARATLIPLLAIPVSLIGTFALFPALGFSINTLSMFGLVLAIGTVVDDAIVVVEAVMHHIEQGKSPREATEQAMREVTGPVIGTSLIMVAVFVPVAFIGGLTGRMYEQFALTIAVSVLISTVCALSLSPALASLLLKPNDLSRSPLRWFYRQFNRGFNRTTEAYVGLTARLARRAFLSIVIIAAVAGGAGWLGRVVPAGFVPIEDQGILLANLQLPKAASLERTREIARRVEDVLATTPGVTSFNVVGGMSFISGTFSPSAASFFIRLDPWEERTTPETQLRGLMMTLRQRMAAIPEGVAFPFVPPTLPGFGASGGFTILLQDRSGTLSVEELGAQTQAFIAACQERPELSGLFTAFDPTVPQIDLAVDREKARTLGVPLPDVFTTLQASLGGAYVNDFNRFGRLYRVFVQAEADFRQKPEDIGQFYVRSQTTGAMIPLSTLVTVTPSAGAEMTVRYNLLRSAEITGQAGPGYSSGQAMAALEEVAADVLPREMGYAFSGLSFQERNAPSSAPTMILAVIFVFLLLAALYESWSLPWSVLLITPTVIFGSLLAVWWFGFDNNVYVQIGFVMLIGLAAKNAILIVEFAKLQRDSGRELVESAVESARLRFRPILMTAFSFILGVWPLVVASGSGANARRMMGTAVLSGMLVATVIGVFLTPAFFVFVEKLAGKGKKGSPAAPPPVDPAATPGGVP
ncbi:MAG TPA: multidrug efflux RND transporter permease subunit [Kiritimatiellia bacterium]|nr:multidrug efflux RND transporter permease subunit [Kiritimatiellia bacterium]HMP35465.1 multidrug efflux RND transporter permease subunit [Kiritimatiellia bacterium]